MAIKIKTQKDYLVTEASMSIELPSTIADLETILKSGKSTGKIVAAYNQGGVMGVTVEQRTRIPEVISQEIRDKVGIGTKEIDPK